MGRSIFCPAGSAVHLRGAVWSRKLMCVHGENKRKVSTPSGPRVTDSLCCPATGRAVLFRAAAGDGYVLALEIPIPSGEHTTSSAQHQHYILQLPVPLLSICFVTTFVCLCVLFLYCSAQARYCRGSCRWCTSFPRVEVVDDVTHHWQGHGSRGACLLLSRRALSYRFTRPCAMHK